MDELQLRGGKIIPLGHAHLALRYVQRAVLVSQGEIFAAVFPGWGIA